MLSLQIDDLDVTVIVLYLVAMLGCGVYFARRTKTDDDLFLAGRRLGWMAIGFSLFASNISSTTLIGLAGAAYTDGLAVANYEWMAALVLVFFAVFIAPVLVTARITTVPEYLERRFDGRSRTYFSGLTIVANVLVDTAGSLYAGALVLRLFFPQLDVTTTCLALALFAGAYTAAGGLAAVVYTDVIQAVVLLIGSVCLTFEVFERLDFSWGTLAAGTSPEMLSVIRPLGDPQLPWLGTLVGVPILGIYFWCTNQFIVQRVLGARNVSHARWGALWGGLLKLPVLFIMVLPGVAARLLYPDLANGDMVYPTLMSRLLPAGLTGLVLAGLLAAIMSSIDSTLNSAATLVTLDFVKRYLPRLTPEQTNWVGRGAILLFMTLAALWAPQIARFQGLFQYLQQMLAFIVPPVVAVFLLGLFWRRGGGRTAFATLLIGHGLAFTVFLGQVTGWLPAIHFTITAGILCAVSAGIYVGFAFTEPRVGAGERDDVIYAHARHAGPPGGPWWRDYRVLSAGLVALTAALVIGFW